MKATLFLMMAVVVGGAVFGAGTEIDFGGRKVNIFAHRGGRHEFEENTMAAFKASYAGGIRGYETDVHMTKDGVGVICHDGNVKRTYANADRVIEEMTIDEIRALRSVKEGHPMPTLTELCDFLADKPGMYVEFEMKTNDQKYYDDARLEEYCRMLHDTAMAKKPTDSVYVFTSFDARVVKKMGELYPAAERMFITGRGLDAKHLEEAKAMGVTRVAAHNTRTTAEMVKKAKKQGFRVSLWPGSTVEQVLLSAALGADDACTDIPMRMLEYFKAR